MATESLFEFNNTRTGISDADAMLWAQNTIQDVKEELESDEIGEFVQAIHNWIQLTKFYNNQQILLYKSGCPDVNNTTFETFSVALLAIGNMICKAVKTGDETQRQTLKVLKIDHEKVSRVYKNIKESYEEWHCEVSKDSQSSILSALNLGDK